MLTFHEQLRAALEALATPEARLGATAALAVSLAVFAVLIAPWIVTTLSQFVREVVLGRERVPLDADQVAWLVPATAAVRALQVAALLLTLFALLLVWGLVDVATLLVVLLLSALPTLGRVAVTLALIAAAFVGTDLLESWITSYAQGTDQINEHQVGIVFRVLQVVLLIAAGIAILGVWDFDLSGLLIGAGFLGIVVGMAARQTLGSLIAGFVLMFSRPFEIGDWIQVGEHEGIVTDITVVNTRIQTFDGEYVMIPNDVVSSESLVNRSRKGRLRIEVEVGVDYDADPERAATVAQRAVSGLDDPMNVPTPQVVLKRLDDSAVVLGVRYWIDNPSARRKWRSRTAVIGAVKESLEAEGIKIPFPQRELTDRDEAAGVVLAGGDRAAEAASEEASAEAASDGGTS